MKKRYILLGSVVFYLFFLRTKKEEKKEVPVNSFDSIGTTIRDFVGDILKDSLRPEPVKEDKGKALEEKAKEKADKIKASVGISTTAGALSKITTGNTPVSSAPATLVKSTSPITTDSVISKEDAIINGLAEIKKAVEDKKEDEKRENEGTNKPKKPNDIIDPDKYQPIAEPVSSEPVDVIPTPPDIEIVPGPEPSEPVIEDVNIGAWEAEFDIDFARQKIHRARELDFAFPDGLPPRYRRRYEELRREVGQISAKDTSLFTKEDFEKFDDAVMALYRQYTEAKDTAPNEDMRILYQEYLAHLGKVKEALLDNTPTD